MLSADVVVVGGGVAGYFTATLLARKKLDVLLVTAGNSSLTYHSGAFDLANTKPDANPWGMVEQLRQTQHPYHLLDDHDIAQGFSLLQEILAEQGLYYGCKEDRNHLLPTALGTFRTTYFLPASWSYPDFLAGLRQKKILVLGLQNYRDFNPAILQQMLAEYGGTVEQRMLPVPLKADFNALDLAENIEAWFAHLENVKNYGCDCLILPAVLGVDKHRHYYRQLKQAGFRRIIEIPCLPPSVPGIRVYRALKAAFRQAGGVVLENQTIEGFQHNGQYLVSLTGRNIEIAGPCFVLATGRFAGGGLKVEDGQARETIFNLPLDEAGWGVTTDAGLQAVYKNLWVVGSLLGGREIDDGTGGGVCIGTANKAARLIGGFFNGVQL